MKPEIVKITTETLTYLLDCPAYDASLVWTGESWSVQAGARYIPLHAGEVVVLTRDDLLNYLDGHREDVGVATDWANGVAGAVIQDASF